MTTIEPRVARMIDVALRSYKEPSERAAMRSALGDAAAICDMLADSAAFRGRGGVVLRSAWPAINALNEAATEIWAMRERIKVRDDDTRTLPDEAGT